MKKAEFADQVITYAIDVALDELKLDTETRIKYYRQAAIELWEMAISMKTEQRFGV